MSGDTPATTVAAINRFFTSLMNRLAGKLDSDAPAVAAAKLTDPFDVVLQGDASATGSTDGSDTLTLTLALANSGVSAGQYGANNKIPVVTLDAKGRVVSAQEVTARSAIQEYATPANFPATGEENLLYIATVGGYRNFFVWGGTAYVNITSTLAVAQLADEATKLADPVSISITGDASWTISFDGSANQSAALTLANTGVTPGTYAKMTVDAKGRVTAGSALVAADIPSLDASKVNSGVFDSARIPTLNQNTTGTAASAAKWTTPRSLTITGDGSWTISIDGSADASAAFTLANSGVVAGTYSKVTVDAKGRVTVGGALTAADIPSLDASKIGSGSIPVSRGGTGGTDQATGRAGLGIGSMATRNVTISTAGPSGGADGDVWFQY